jgi:bacteriorhodopsin
MTVETILLIGVVLFTISSLYFLFQGKKGLNTPLLVSVTTLISYVVMVEGRYLLGSTEDAQHWTRWAFYGLSCCLLALEICKQLGFKMEKTVKNMFLTVLTMFTGVLASVFDGNFKWALFAISCFVFGIFVYDIFTSQSKNLAKITPYIIFGWAVFPVVFLLSNEGLELIAGVYSVSLYLLLDLFTKIVFYLQVAKETK